MRSPKKAELRAWLAVDSAAGGLSFGGLRVDPDVSERLAARLAECMTWKLAGHGLPVGGAKAVVRARPDDPRLPRFLEELGHRWRPLLSGSVVLGKDLGASDAHIAALYRGAGVAQLAPAGLAGRLASLPGYRKRMTALGVLWSAQEALGSLRGKRLLIQGWGVVGRGSAQRLRAAGARLAGWSDEHGTSRGEPREALLAAPGDLLVLAARSDSVDEKAAALIRCPVVVEAANLGLTDGARRLLERRGVKVVPDVVAGSSSAALVGRQLAARGTLGPRVVWRRIEAAIRENARAALRLGRAGYLKSIAR